MNADKAKVTYSDAIEAVMKKHGGYAPLHIIYRDIWLYKDRDAISGKTPEQTIQERVQRDSRFVRMALGVYALKDYQERDKLPKPEVAKTDKDKKIRQHSEIEGKLLLLGNHLTEVANTYTADKGALFSGGELRKVATLSTLPAFTYKNIVHQASLTDVVWLNARKFPSHFFEVEHTTDFGNALIKFCDLQDFHADFICVADKRREGKFVSQLNRAAFAGIRDRCRFKAYEEIEDAYNKRQRPVI